MTKLVFKKILWHKIDKIVENEGNAFIQQKNFMINIVLDETNNGPKMNFPIKQCLL